MRLKQRSTAGGFGLVELMIALVLGIVVSGAVIAFVAAIVQASGRTVQVSRLDQELRSLTEVISREIRRARAINDPMQDIGSECTTACAGEAVAEIDTATAGCIKFAYENPQDPTSTDYFRTISLDDGQVKLAQGDTAQDCGTGTALNTGLVNVTALTFDEAIADTLVAITVSGELANVDSIENSYTTSVAIRSGAP